MDIIQTQINNLIKGINDKLDDKFKEACRLWSVDIDNHEDVKRRCEVKIYDGVDERELYIDDYLVMIFTMPKTNKFDSKKPLNLSVEFKCSQIIKPNSNSYSKQISGLNNDTTM